MATIKIKNIKTGVVKEVGKGQWTAESLKSNGWEFADPSDAVVADPSEAVKKKLNVKPAAAVRKPDYEPKQLKNPLEDPTLTEVDVINPLEEENENGKEQSPPVDSDSPDEQSAFEAKVKELKAQGKDRKEIGRVTGRHWKQVEAVLQTIK